MEPIAHIRTPYKAKFGVPRQAGLVANRARIVFEPPYRAVEALRGLEEMEYIWIIWLFHLATRKQWSPTVRPPRLGGNHRVGVFATRSPFRPNPIGLSCVRLLDIEPHTADGPSLIVEGADLVDGTPILDIKPYIPYTDAHPEASAGFAQQAPTPSLTLTDDQQLLRQLTEEEYTVLTTTLCYDPRPRYHEDPQRVYTMTFGTWEVGFRVADGIVHIIKLIPRQELC